MGVNLGSLLVSLGLDSGEFKSGLNQAEKDFRRTERSFDQLGKKMANVGRNLSIAVTAPLVALGVASFKAASDAAEMESAFDVSFGASANSVKKWAEETGNAMGRSTQEMMGMAASFQDILKKQMDPGAASELSKTLTVLTQDLASFKNLSNDVAQQKIFSGLIGEAEPLRAVGVLLSATAVEAKALEMGLAATKKEISEGAKVQARAALIMEQLSDAQGDVIRTSDSTANQMKTASAAFEELRVTVGQKLIPALTPLITAVTGILEAFNTLSPEMQEAIVIIGGLAAAVGPVMLVFGNLVSFMKGMLAAFVTMKTAVAAATVATGSLIPALAALRAMFVSLAVSMAPWLIALGLVAGAIYLLVRRSGEAAQASAAYRDQQEKLEKVQERVKNVTQQLAVATGEARREALRNAHAIREETKQYLANAKAALQAAQAKLAAVRANNLEEMQTAVRTVRGAGGNGGDPINRQGATNRKREAAARNAFIDAAAEAGKYASELRKIEQTINAPPPEIANVAAIGDDEKKNRNGPRGRTGRSAAEIESMFVDEQRRLEMEALSAKERLATNIEDRVDLQYEMLNMEREQRLAEINENEDFSAKQKAALQAQIEALYGKAAQIDEQGNIIANANRGLIAQQLEQDRAAEEERKNADLAAVNFANQRELLSLQGAMADTQAERKRIALGILALEQQERRQALERIANSTTLDDAIRERARLELAALSEIEKGETAATKRANETEIERYLRDINKSPEQINEAIGSIQIDGLESLNSGLVDAIMGVKSLGDVFANVTKQIVADLLRIAVQRAIIGPLADTLFGAAGSNGARSGGFFAGLFGGSSGPANLLEGIPGYANGTPFHKGGLAIVGERGPELVNMGRGSQVMTNAELRSMGGDRDTRISVEASPYFDVRVNGHIAASSPGIMEGGAQVATSKLSRRQSRSLRG